MNTISAWWEALDLSLQIFYCIGTVALLGVGVQFLMALFGGDGGDDLSLDGDSGPQVTGHFLSFRGLTAFAMGLGWMGVIALKWGWHPLAAAGAGIVAGVAIEALFLLMMSQLMKLQSDGTFKLERTVGGVGTVYVSLPPNGTGEVIIKAAGRSVHAKAFNNTPLPLKSGAEVSIKALHGSGVLVEPLEEN